MIPRPSPDNEAVFLALVVIFLTIGLARYLEGERFRLFIRSFFNTNLIDQQIRQERAFSRLALLAFILVIGIETCFATLTFQRLGYFGDISFLGLFVIIAIAIILITTARVAIYAVLSWLFELDALQQHHSFQWLLNNTMLSLILLPLTVLIALGPSTWAGALTTIGIALIIGFYSLRVVRFALIATGGFRVPVHYNFLYICALEIAPLLVALAAISRNWVG